MNPQQRFLLLLILVGALATVLGLVSKRARLLPYPVVLAAAGIAVGLLPGGNFPSIGPDAILAATDPIAVVSLLRRLHAPKGLAAILEGESLFNDGTGVAVFTAVLATILSGAPSVGDASLRFVEITIGGIVIGLVI